MLSRLFGGPTVQLVEYEEGRVLFKSKKEPTRGVASAFKVVGISGRVAKIKALVRSVRPLETGGYLSLADVCDPLSKDLLAPLQGINSGPGLRRYPRSARKVDIHCRDLVATSIDISTGGMQVTTSMKVEPGQSLFLQLIPGLSCRARVAWVQQERAGLEFQDTDEATKLLLTRFAEGRVIPTARRSPHLMKMAVPPDYKSLETQPEIRTEPSDEHFG